MIHASWFELVAVVSGLAGQAVVIGGLLALQWVSPHMRNANRWYVVFGFGLSLLSAGMAWLSSGSFSPYVVFAVVGFILALTPFYSGAEKTKYGITVREALVWASVLFAIFLQSVGDSFADVSRVSFIVTAFHTFMRDAWIGLPIASFVLFLPRIMREQDRIAREQAVRKLGRRMAFVWPILFSATVLTGMYVWYERAHIATLAITLGCFAFIGLVRSVFSTYLSLRALFYSLFIESVLGVAVFVAMGKLLVAASNFEPWNIIYLILCVCAVIGVSALMARTAWMNRQLS